MSNIPSGRHNPDQIRYYQALADTIAIFWQFHSERLKSGNLPLALHQYRTTGKYEAFDPQRVMLEHPKGKYHMTVEYGEAISLTINASWEQYLELMRQETGYNFLDRMGVQIPGRLERFSTPYSRTRLKEAHELSLQRSPVFQAQAHGIDSVMIAGIGTGAKTTTHIIALMGKEFSPLTALILSKVSIYKIAEMRDNIGAPYSANMFNGTENFTLFNDSPRHIDMTLLKTFGYGEAIGCPAGMPPSEETRAFLSQIRSPLQTATMLEGFATTLETEFDRTLTPWFRKLSPEDREYYLDPLAKRLLSGESRATFCTRKEG